MLNMQGHELVFPVKNPPSHWMFDVCSKSGKDVFVSNIGAKGNRVKEVSLFWHESDLNKVKNLVSGALNCTVEHVTKNPEGVFAAIECESTPLDDIMMQITSETSSRVWAKCLFGLQGVELVVENPWDEDVTGQVLDILGKKQLQLKENPSSRKKEMEVPIPSDQGLEKETVMDNLDKKIAKTLLMRGYYETPRPDGVTQELLCKELRISKPTLEDRMRRIQSIGIKNLLALREFSKEDMELSWKLYK